MVTEENGEHRSSAEPIKLKRSESRISRAVMTYNPSRQNRGILLLAQSGQRLSHPA